MNRELLFSGKMEGRFRIGQAERIDQSFVKSDKKANQKVIHSLKRLKNRDSSEAKPRRSCI